MGLFDLFGSSSRRSGRDAEYRAALRELRKQQSIWYRGVRTAIIIAAALSITLLILALIVADLRKEWVFKLIFVVFALIFGGALCLPWITELARDERRAKNGENIAKWRKFVAYGFFGFIGVSTIFWIISVFTIGNGIIDSYIKDTTTEFPPNAFTPLRVAIILTIQVLLGSVIATSTLRFGKKYLGLRIVMYVTLAYLDLWGSMIAATVTIAGFTSILPFQTALWVLAVLATVGLAAAAGIFGAQTRRKEIELIMKGDTKTLAEEDVELLDAQTTSSVYTEAPKTSNTAAQKSVEEQLAKLNDLRNKGIITEEEYQRKRQDIIDKM